MTQKLYIRHSSQAVERVKAALMAINRDGKRQSINGKHRGASEITRHGLRTLHEATHFLPGMQKTNAQNQ